MAETITNRLEKQPIQASAPCRVDMGGTLDISTFHYPLQYLHPATFNIAIGLRTHVRLLPFKSGWVKVSSRGFTSAEYPLESVPFNHSLGLMFAIAAHFNVSGIHIDIQSSSPPRSALGGSSAAAVALVGSYMRALDLYKSTLPTGSEIALTAHALEASIAGVPCGLQDQLAAVFGGVNAWYWKGSVKGVPYQRQQIIPKSGHGRLSNHLLLAYCGKPHESKDINGKWVRQFISGKHRQFWEEIVHHTHDFTEALRHWDFKGAVGAMNAEMAIRRQMTPDVLDPMGVRLVDTAVEADCGARFAGAGGGGCLWAIGEKEDIEQLTGKWRSITATHKDASLLDIDIDSEGLIVDD